MTTSTDTQQPTTPTEPVTGSSILSYELPNPQQLREQLPLNQQLADKIVQQRQQVRDILQQRDPRLLVVIGPCSIHDPQAALEYAQRLELLNKRLGQHMLLAMRVYIEKPRTTVGWKGLLYDPHLDGSYDMHSGLEQSRSLMLSIAELGLPVATELLQPLAAQYFSDLLSWVAIGARTSESQIHREMVSGLQLPTGFKNGTDGSVQIAIDAMRSAAYGHQYMGVDECGQIALLQALGNPDTHLVLRGGQNGSNYGVQAIKQAMLALEKSGLQPSIMVDCSHANSGKNPLRQEQVLLEVVRQRQQGNHNLCAVMLESHLHDGAQQLGTFAQLRALLDGGYTGAISLEPFAPEVLTLPDPAPAIRECIVELREALSAPA